jgi:transcriptional regulator with XRE-family HTH domain
VEQKQPSYVDVHVGERIRIRRKQLGLTQDNLANMLGLTFQQVQKYERGMNRISAGRLFGISKVLDLSVSFFFDGLAEDAPTRGLSEEDNDALRLPPEAADLVAAFAQIKNPRIRRKLVEMARVMASEVDDEGGPSEASKPGAD